MSRMRALVYLSVAAAAAGVAAFASLEFLAVDSCLDRGGRVVAPGASCEGRAGNLESLYLGLTWTAWLATSVTAVTVGAATYWAAKRTTEFLIEASRT